jgi:hypothetical protein
MNPDSPPALRELPRDRLEQRKVHLMSEIAHERSSSPFVGRALAAAATLALAATVVGFLVTRGGTETASAAEVRAKLAEGLRFRQSIRGEFSVRTQDPGPRPRGAPGCVNCAPVVPRPSKFVVGADGSYSSLALSHETPPRVPCQTTLSCPPDDVAYNASTGIETRCCGLEGSRGRPVYFRGSHLDPAFAGYGPQAQLGAWVQGALADGNRRVENTTYDGRPAWKLTVRFIVDGRVYGFNGARIDVVVDRATGLVLEVTRYAYSTDRWTSIESVHDLKIGGPTSAADFTVPRPAGTRLLAHDYGFRRVAAAEIASVVGYRPLLPTNTLGRSLSDVAVAKKTDIPTHDVVSARYGNGPESVSVSTRRATASERRYRAPEPVGRPVHMARGALAGDDGYITTSPLSSKFLIAYHRGLIVEIHAPSARGAIAVANSLRSAR